MSKGIDIVPLLRYVDEARHFKKEEDKKPRHRTPKPKDWEELWLEEHARREKFDAFMKVMKKQVAEEKKEEKKKGWSVDHIAMAFMLVVPINWAVMYLLTK